MCFVDETATASSEEKNGENPNENENDNETENEKEKEQKEEVEEEGGEAGNDEDGGAHFNDDVRTCIRHIILFIIYDIFIMQRNSSRSFPAQILLE